MLESGQLSRIWNKWRATPNKVKVKSCLTIWMNLKDCLGTGVSALGPETVSSIFYILALAGFLSGLILLAEIVYK